MASAAKTRITRPPYLKVILSQLFVTFCLAILASLFSTIHGYSALLGGLICSIPNALFIYRSFLYQGARAAEQIVKSFYKAEATKLALTALLFGMTFKFVEPLEPLTLFIAFFLVQVVHWFSPVLMRR